MTASDPSLTELLAAHLLTRGWSDGIEVFICMECGDEWWTASEFAEHLKMLVDQHDNGRIAAVAIADARRWEARADKAEATIARVEKLKGDLFQRGGNLIAQWGAARLIGAALEGPPDADPT
ncbi:hypothetical protein R3Q06_10605 [Rhodococcus erythropolis]|uniref:hypothetical protein n=1 Tax=Rhodococcus erythropolis TaxID=1833 RepID=UPI00294A2E6F|nr:hypothetical protein [Rhodococcus erythropolis]MDV6273948.1 hypothetical protein [Rhodococcus erythropolis]